MDLISHRESLRVVRERAARLRPSVESVSVREALHRITAAPVHSRRDNPVENLAAMDGIAVDVRLLATLPARLPANEWCRVNTGEPVPPQYNAVIKIEDVRWDGDAPVVEKETSFHQHIRRPGEDFTRGTLLFTAGYRLHPQDLSLLLAAGYETIDVYRKPLVTFIPTGSELTLRLPAEGSHGVVESNSALVAGMVESCGGVFHLHDPVPDEEAALSQAIRLALSRSDILIVSAGTSMGTRDITFRLLESMGKVHFHGVAMSPARPVLFAEIGDVPVIGLPGYPVAAFIASFLYLRPLLAALSCVDVSVPSEVLISGEEIPSRDVDHYYRVQVYDVDGRLYVRRISRGAGSIFSLGRMDGLMHLPPGGPVHTRDAVRVDWLRNRARHSLAVRGVNDPILLRLFDLFEKEMPGHRILFWDAPSGESLQSIVERNTHFASIPTGRIDYFPDFQSQLQEVMLRIRVVTRSIGILLPGSLELKPGMRVAVPRRNETLFQELQGKNPDFESLRVIPVGIDEETLAASMEAGHWDAVFCDERFVRAGQKTSIRIQEHIDLVIPQGLSETPPVRKLLEILRSDSFREWVDSHRGCESAPRSKLVES